MNEKAIPYRTRDGSGNDIVKNVKVKTFKPTIVDFVCPVCKKTHHSGVKVKDIVSSNFTDWALVGDYVCQECSELFNLYFYNYIVDPNGIRLLNVRELRDQLIRQQKPPFLFVITTSQKKHLFYRSIWNYSADRIAVNLETETIHTTPERMKTLFDFVECLQTLGCGKERLKGGEIPFHVLRKIGKQALDLLRRELIQSREIQIPLYCGQKREISEEEPLCCINSTLTV